MPSLLPEPLQCTLGRNSSWSRSCPSLTVSGCTYTKVFWVCTFQSEQPQSTQHLSFSLCSPVRDGVCQCRGQVVLQGLGMELLEWAFFDSQMESWHSSVVKRVCSFMPCLPRPSGTAQAKSRTSKFRIETFFSCLQRLLEKATVAGILRASLWSKGDVLLQNSIILPSFPVGYPCQRISRQRLIRNRKKPPKIVKLKPSGTELLRVHRGS